MHPGRFSAARAAFNLICALALVSAGCFSSQAETPAEATREEAPAGGAPLTEEEVVVMTTSQGVIVLRLFPDVAPNHVEKFTRLVANGAYEGMTFHRVIPNFMIQGGDPNSLDENRTNDGLGGIGPPLQAEFSSITHRRGILSTARKPNSIHSATSQFFIMVGDQPALDNKYTVFGMVVEGMETVDRIAALRRDRRDNPLPENPARIEKIELKKVELEPRPPWTMP